MEENFLAKQFYNRALQNNLGDGSGALLQYGQPEIPLLNSDQGFGFNPNTLNTVGQGFGALKDLAGIYFGNKQLGLAKDQFNFSKDFGNRNIENQAKLVNNSLEARYRAALAARGQGVDGQNSRGGQGQTSESLQSYLDRSKVDGSPVGGG